MDSFRRCEPDCPGRPEHRGDLPGSLLDALWEEIKTHGYTGGYGAVRTYLQPFRTSPIAPAARPPSPRTVTGWILTHPDTLPESERLKLKSVLAGSPELDALTRHVRAFGKMLAQLQGDQLPP
ncbi:hypothetical protein ACIRP2_37450 [Streptomyces sp. NPDC101194]|uniref:hypothetical protein n=1 Tax=Streptomyces sp. NPDC101194 TaxID=3366127 RepID=UPI0037F3B87C